MMNFCFFFALALIIIVSNITRLCLAITIFNSTTDQHALLAFKNAIISDHNGISARNWSSNSSVCYWIGVSCSIKHHRVIALNFSGFQLAGKLDPHIGNLTFLRSLDISNNDFKGVIPRELSRLRRLEKINVGGNSFTGEIPSWFEALSELQYVSLNNNTFSGQIPLSLFNISGLRTLDARYNSLGGTIPHEIANLSSLETITLEGNRFTGSIPSGIFSISSLQEMNFRINNLSGEIPNDICSNTPKLKVMQLSGNQLEGKIPSNIYKCSGLEDLRLPVNYLSGNIPREIGNLTMLRRLSLFSNEFKGNLPEELANLAFLKSLNVRNNSLSGFIPSSMFNMSTLKALELSENGFVGSLPSNMGLTLYNLEELFLRGNLFYGRIPSSISNASKLVLLDFSFNSFSGSIPDLGDLRFLEILVISENKLTSPTEELGFLSSLTNCQYLENLQIAANPLNGTLPSTIGNLSTYFHVFVADTCNLKGVIPPQIGNLSSLQSIYLNVNELTGTIPTTIGTLKQLLRLYLNDNQLQGYIPPHLCQNKDLGELYLSSNMLTGPIPECLGEQNSLKEVFFDSNKMNSTIPSNFWNLRDLLFLNLSSNYFSGSLSFQIGGLRAVGQLDLSSNQFSGEIPSSIDGCQVLQILSLSNNKFDGHIPQSLGSIRGLTTLDLSNNNFSGVIPNSLQDLQTLQYFNVSFNRLQGAIPNGGPFVNFTPESFIHNSALCGAARFQVPPCVVNHTRSRLKSWVLVMKYIVPPVLSTAVLVVIVIIIVRRRKLKRTPAPIDISVGTPWRRVSYRELAAGTSDFSESNLLGRGSFGSVFKGILSDGLEVAVKVFNLQLEGAIKSFDTESEILSSIRHRNLVRIIGCCSNMEFKALILAYMPNGSLEKWLYSDNYSLDLLQRLEIAMDVALALEYLHCGHTFPVVHCDIKPSNVLLDEDMTAHVSDFGISKLFDEGEDVIQTKTLATIGYAAPEYGSEGKVSTSGDVYSYGILLLEMFTRKRPTDDMFNEEMNLKEWVNEALKENATSDIVAAGLMARDDEHFSAKEQFVESIFHVAMKCLAFSPEERINMIETVVALQKIKTDFLKSVPF